MVLKQSMKNFHTFTECFLLPADKMGSTLVVKAVELVDLGGFVVASEQEEVLRVFDLVGE